jgi:hypothetical protein
LALLPVVQAKENVALAALVVHLLDFIQPCVRADSAWTKGHAGKEGNERAHEAAGWGCDPDSKNSWRNTEGMPSNLGAEEFLE